MFVDAGNPLSQSAFLAHCFPARPLVTLALTILILDGLCVFEKVLLDYKILGRRSS